jgi:hypothetical protein
VAEMNEKRDDSNRLIDGLILKIERFSINNKG